MATATTSNGTNGNTAYQDKSSYLGVTPPISLNEPTAYDLKNTVELEKVLKENDLYETAEGSRKREEVLGKLNVIVKEWVRKVSINKVSCDF